MDLLDKKIQKAKEELAKYEEMVLNGEAPDDAAKREEAERLDKFLTRYKKVLDRAQSDESEEQAKESLSKRTLNILNENDEYNQKCEKYIRRKSKQLEELKALYADKRKQRKEILAKNQESTEAFNEELQNRLNKMKKQKRAYAKLLKGLKQFDADNSLSMEYIFESKDLMKSKYNKMMALARNFNFDNAKTLAKEHEEKNNDLINKQKSKIKELEDQIKNAKSDLSDLKEREQQREKYLRDKERIENNISKTRKHTNNIVQNLANEMEKKRPLIDAKFNINDFNAKIDKFNFQKVSASLQEKANKISSIDKSKLSPKTVNIDPSKFELNLHVKELDGFVKYKTYKAAALEFCTDPAEFEFFLYDDAKLIEIYKKKLAQRNKTREDKERKHKAITDQFRANHKKFLLNLKRVKDENIKKQREEELNKIYESVKHYLEN